MPPLGGATFDENGRRRSRPRRRIRRLIDHEKEDDEENDFQGSHL